MDPASSARRAWLVGLLFLLIVGPWVKELTAQPAARMALTAAIVEHGTIRVDAYELTLGVDQIEREGHLYSDKAPGQPFLAVPFYAVERAIGAESAVVVRGDGNLTLWWITFWFSAVPGSLLVVLMCRLCDVDGALVPLAAAAIAFGTLLLPFSAELYGHVLATLLGVTAWWLVREERPTGRVVVAGACAGLAVVVEYQMVLFVAIVGLLLVVRAGWRVAGYWALAGVPFALALLMYQAAAFGSPFRSSYGEKPGGGTAVVGVPDPQRALEVLFGSRGLILFTPIVVVGLVGLIRTVRGSPSVARDDAILGLAVFVAYFGLQASWPNAWGGEMPGPRYMIPALPLLAPGVAVTWRRGAVLERVLVVWSVAVMTLPLMTLHLVPAGGVMGISHWRNLDDFGVSPTVWTLAFGEAGWLVHAATVLGVVALLRREVRSRRSRASAGVPPSPMPS